MISVCLASYNGEKYIKEQIDSILFQLDDNDELIISDDGSSDKTISIINEYNDKRITVLQNKYHGVVHNFENALSYAKGDYIFLSDQDDEWMPNKVEKCLCILKDYDCVVSDCYICNGNGNITHESFFSVNGTKQSKIYNLLINNGYMGSCMAFKRCVLSVALPFPKNIPLHDLWIGNIAAFKFNIKWIPDRLIKYRRHGSNASSSAEKSNTSFMKKLGYRWHIIKWLLRV